MALRWITWDEWVGTDGSGLWITRRRLQFWTGGEWRDVPEIDAGSATNEPPPPLD